jgi:glycosyltransferase involved in cell wall biosynthesis
MIVKNEEKYIEMCLKNALKLVDEIIIVDTGSTDSTLDIIKKFGDQISVYQYKWEDDFAKARNISLEKATGDWILVLDADEKIICDVDKFRKQLEETEYEGIILPLYNIINKNSIMYSSVYCKLFRNKGYRYNGIIHENINIKPNKIVEFDSSICKIFHYGYMKNVVNGKDKAKRNREMLFKQLEKEPQNPYVYYNIGVTHMVNENWQEALDYFFKCNALASQISLTEVTRYEIDMAKRMAECLCQLEQYEVCIDFVDDLLGDVAYYGFVDLVYIKAHCYFTMKNYDEAIKNFEECLKIGETKKFVTIHGTGSFLPKIMLAKIYSILKNENMAINKYMDCVFDPNNYTKEGLEEFRTYLTLNNRIEILNHLNTLVGTNDKF